MIRGQEGKRIKVLSSGNETLDMSAMSPDHAVAVDSLLAKKLKFYVVQIPCCIVQAMPQV